GRGTSVLVELSGAPAALEVGLALLAHEGTALVGSWYGTKRVSLPLGSEFHPRRLTIRHRHVRALSACPTRGSRVVWSPAALASCWARAGRRATVRLLLAELPLDVLATSEF